MFLQRRIPAIRNSRQLQRPELSQKCGKNKLKSGKNYYFYVEPQKKVGNKYVSGLAGNANYCWSLKYKK